MDVAVEAAVALRIGAERVEGDPPHDARAHGVLALDLRVVVLRDESPHVQLEFVLYGVGVLPRRHVALRVRAQRQGRPRDASLERERIRIFFSSSSAT